MVGFWADDLVLGVRKRCVGFFFPAGDLCLRFLRGNGLLGGALFPFLARFFSTGTFFLRPTLISTIMQRLDGCLMASRIESGES